MAPNHPAFSPACAAVLLSALSPKHSTERLHPTLSGGRTWWAHFEFTRINIEPTILRKKIEELMNIRGVGENFLKLKNQLTVGTPKANTDRSEQR
jgi:hypothetical protein